LLFRIGAEVAVGDLVGRQIRDQLLQVLGPAVSEAEQPRREARVAARLVLGRALENEDLLLVLGLR
jgi:hypothetical protein